MQEQKSTYLIIRQDRLNDRVEVQVDGMRIGSWQGCELWLNHPSISSLHAGIRELNGRFYITDLSPSNLTTLNGRIIVFGEPEALADGDVLQIGPFFLEISRVGKALGVSVTQQPGLMITDTQARTVAATVENRSDVGEARPASSDEARALELFWEKRSRTRSAPQTRLHTEQPRPAGKARLYWQPTSDLVRPWPASIFIWSLVCLGAMLCAFTYLYPNAFSPGPISVAHARETLAHGHEIARRPSSSSCLTCHAQGAKIDANCASCHQAEMFVATVTPAHQKGQVGCSTCHQEHLGKDFSPSEAALKMCADCHNNQTTYNGTRMKTPHQETGFGYPVVDGEWKWKGLDEEEWASRSAQAKKWLPGDQRLSRVVQFHALHVNGIPSVKGLPGNKEGEISCSSCHNYYSPRIDTETPRTRCAACHNGKTDEQTQRVLIASDQPNCSSCHIQHVLDKRLGSSSSPVEESHTRTISQTAIRSQVGGSSKPTSQHRLIQAIN